MVFVREQVRGSLVKDDLPCVASASDVQSK